ncbi:hypothetical protein E4U12_000674, partial [Claviceps purpurea]
EHETKVEEESSVERREAWSEKRVESRVKSRVEESKSQKSKLKTQNSRVKIQNSRVKSQESDVKSRDSAQPVKGKKLRTRDGTVEGFAKRSPMKQASTQESRKTA